MDFRKFNLLKSKAFMLAILYSVISAVFSQLSQSDLNYIHKTILADQDETTGVFGKSYLTTYKSVKILEILKFQVPNQSKICRDLGYETKNPVKLEYIELNNLLDCRHDFANLDELKPENLVELNLASLYEKLLILHKLRKPIDWKSVSDNLTAFKDVDDLFSNVRSGYSNLANTVQALHLYTIMHKEAALPEELRESAKAQIYATFTSMLKEFQLLREDIGYFADSSSLSLHLNSDVAQILEDVNGIISIENYDDLCLRLLNYFLTFKYSMNNIDNIFYYVSAVNNFRSMPILVLEKSNFSYLEEKTVDLKLINAFGNELNNYKVQLNYTVSESDEKAEAPKKEKDSTDLEDEVESTVEAELSASFDSLSKFKIDVSKYVKKPTLYVLRIVAGFVNDKSYSFKYNFNLRSFSKVKINHIKMSVSNTSEKNDEKETTIEFPKRSFKSIKATQKSVIRLKVNINHGDAQKNKIEQLFLRLRHVEYGKSYSAYVKEYKVQDDNYHIAFDMSDPNVMDAYDGTYEITLILSDVTMDNPVIWNFGKIEVTFRKPLDPSNLSSNYKNIQKPKMEPTFEVEQSSSKNFLGSLVFTGLLGFITFYYFIFLKSFRANIEHFSKGKRAETVFSILFILFVLMTAYVLVLFFIKLNIVQTLIILGVLFVPGVVITYKALSAITIEV